MFFSDTEKSIPMDVRNVLDVAALLQITEFHLFHIAYRYWHGRDTSDYSIERVFVPYMFRSVVPFWVRQLCRHVLQAQAEGTLDPTQLGLDSTQVGLEWHELSANAHSPRRSVLAMAGVVIAMLVLAASLGLSY